MNKTIKFLTLIVVLAIISQTAFASNILNQVKFKTHLRWNIFASKTDVKVLKKGNDIILKTNKLSVFDELKKDLAGVATKNSYIKNISISDKNLNDGSVGRAVVTLSSDAVELFSFYRESDKKHVLDFWIDKDSVPTVAAAPKPVVKKPVVKVTKPKKVAKKKAIKSPNFKKLTATDKVRKENLKKYRDFRYGTSFVWNYPSLSPEVESRINIERKTPEFFYKVKDRDFNKSEKEAHLQLTINLYRKNKYGLMYKSIKLFQKKYGDEDSLDVIDYLRANALLKNNLKKGASGPEKMGLNILSNLGERTSDYELKKSIYKYLLDYLVKNDEYIKSLALSKKFYVKAREEYDMEEARYASEVMLHSLAKLDQISVIKKLLADKIIEKTLPKQLRIAYESYVHLKLNNEVEVIKIFENNQKSLVMPIHPAIIYNTAEAYFREAKYKKAIKLFDQYLANYSHTAQSNAARVRIALSYDLLGKNIAKTLELYRSAINRTTDSRYNYEAKIRYVALRSVRKQHLTEEDKEVRIFLDNRYGENFVLGMDLKKILWQTRLRTLIVDAEYTKALSYLKAIPVGAMKPAEQHVFDADGAEVIYGIIHENYKNSDYSKVVHTWELYKDKYISTVAADPTINFIVARSYVKLGLYKGFDKVYASFAKIKDEPSKTFPVWVKRKKIEKTSALLYELKVISNYKLKNYDAVQDNLNQLKKISPKYNMISYYQGILDYKNKKYEECIINMEAFLSSNTTNKIYDSSDIADIIGIYTNSLYEKGDLNKFKTVASAILKDTKGYASKNRMMEEVRERVAYLAIEILAGEKSAQSSLQVVAKTEEFLNNYKGKTYRGRVQYLQAVAKIANKDEIGGTTLLNELLVDADVSSYIKGLVKTELALLEIKKRTL